MQESDQEARIREIERRQNKLAQRLKEIEEKLSKAINLGITTRQMTDNT
jgi:chaperonin cofactor prefoldin